MPINDGQIVKSYQREPLPAPTAVVGEHLKPTLVPSGILTPKRV